MDNNITNNEMNNPAQPQNNVYNEQIIPNANNAQINPQVQMNVNVPTDNIANNQNKKKGSKIILIVIIIAILVGAGIFAVKMIKSKETNTDDLKLSTNELILVKSKENNKYGYINLDGTFVIEPQFKTASAFVDNYAIVSKETTIEDNTSLYYHVIDTKGNVKATATSTYYLEYIEDYKIWVINDVLYDSNLNKLSEDGIDVQYEDNGYLKWTNTQNKTAGIMNAMGQLTFTYQFQNNETSFSFVSEDIHSSQNERYCAIRVNYDKDAIVNCDTGKKVYDFIENRITSYDDHIFIIYDSSTFETISKIFINNDSVVYTGEGSRIYLSYYGSGYLSITDYDKPYAERYSYYNTKTGEFTATSPTDLYNYSTSTNIDNDSLWESETNIQKFSCSNGYGLMSENNIKIPCEWTSIKYFNIDLYKYLSSNGKKYVLGTRDNKSYLIDLKTNSAVAEFNASATSSSDSTFIYYKDALTNKMNIYNLLTGKSLEIDNDSYYDAVYSYTPYLNYFTLKEDNKRYYYNMNLKVFYIEEN